MPYREVTTHDRLIAFVRVRKIAPELSPNQAAEIADALADVYAPAESRA